jgi:hypothetical protein
MVGNGKPHQRHAAQYQQRQEQFADTGCAHVYLPSQPGIKKDGYLYNDFRRIYSPGQPAS